MKAIGTKAHRIGWIRVSHRHPAAPQIAAIGAHCKITYNSANGDTIGHVIQALRPGNEVYVHGLHRLGSTRRELTAALEAIRKIGARLYDTEVQAFVDVACLEAASAAIGIINGEARMPTAALARKRGKLGGKPLAGTKMSDIEARKLWTNAKLTNQEAADAIGLSLRTCYRRFGDSGRPAGWPKRKK